MTISKRKREKIRKKDERIRKNSKIRRIPKGKISIGSTGKFKFLLKKMVLTLRSKTTSNTCNVI